jgi:hypothetical protein
VLISAAGIVLSYLRSSERAPARRADCTARPVPART